MTKEIQKTREHLVNLCLETLDLTKNGRKLEPKTRAGIHLSVQKCMDMPDELVGQGIEALEEFNSKLRP